MFRLIRSTGFNELTMTAVIGLSFAIAIVSFTNEPMYAEQKITIIPDAHSDTAVRFVDITDYFLSAGEELTWFNDDFVDLKLVITNEDNATAIADLDLKSNSSASHVFKEPGKYYYSSEEYPRIQGSVRVLDPSNVSSQKITGLKNDVDVQLTWTPSQIALVKPDGSASSKGENGETQAGRTDFIIAFIDNKTGINQEHIDYKYTISDEQGNAVFTQGLHSTYGVEEATYKFEQLGSFNPQVIITNILFAPVDPDVADFDTPISVHK